MTSVKHQMDKPPRMDVVIDNVPESIKKLDRWLGWRWKWKSKKWDKPPVDVRTGKNGSSTNADSWANLKTAWSAYAQGTVAIDGLGVALGEIEPGVHLVGVDFDNCRNRDTGEVDPAVQGLVRMLDTYCEVSPSGEGLKLLMFGTMPEGMNCKYHLPGGVEMEVYQQGRYFTVTGSRYKSSGNDASHRTKELKKLYQFLTATEGQKTAASGDDINVAKQAIQHLAPARADDYFDWINVGMALHSVHDSLLDAWDQWSQQSDKYQPGDCAAKWASFKGHYSGRPITLGSLLYWAQEDTNWKPPGRTSRKQGEETTDLGNARRLVKRYGAKTRYVGTWGKWLAWDGTRWKRDGTGVVDRCAQKTARRIYDEARDTRNRRRGKKLRAWAKQSQSKPRLEAMKALAASQPEVAITHEVLDRQPHLLNCKNGTVDLRTGELRPHDPADLITQTTGVEYPTDPVVPSLWLQTLDTVFDGDKAIIEFLQRLFGLILLGEVREHLLPIFHGDGANGKSVVVETVMGVMGEYALKAPRGLCTASKHEQHPTALADLCGKRLAVITETADGERLDEALVKELTGGDTVRARRMREDFWQFEPSHSVLMVTNHRPLVSGVDNGIWRRIKLIPFNVEIPESKQDPELRRKLKAEYAGILRWMVEGCLACQFEGLRPPEAVELATSEYRREMDSFGQFVQECCDLGSNCSIRSSLLINAYEEWCDDQGLQPISRVAFGKHLKKLPGVYKRRSNGIVYEGIDIAREGIGCSAA